MNQAALPIYDSELALARMLKLLRETNDMRNDAERLAKQIVASEEQLADLKKEFTAKRLECDQAIKLYLSSTK